MAVSRVSAKLQDLQELHGAYGSKPRAEAAAGGGVEWGGSRPRAASGGSVVDTLALPRVDGPAPLAPNVGDVRIVHREIRLMGSVAHHVVCWVDEEDGVHFAARDPVGARAPLPPPVARPPHIAHAGSLQAKSCTCGWDRRT